MSLFDVTIAGEVNLDLILYGLNEEIPVEREVLASGFAMTLGSSSAILAHNLSLLGTRVGFATRVGDDALGRIALDRLAEGGVDLSRTTQASGGTKTGVTILLHHGRTRRILTYPGVMFEMTCADLDVEYLASARHFHLSSLFLQKGLLAGLPQLVRTLKGRELTISLDTNDDPEDRWGGVLDEILPLVDLLLPNEDEVRRIARRDTVEAALDALAETIPLIAVKCGRQGAMVQRGRERLSVAAAPVEPVDTIGAGDSFNAGFLAAWLNGAALANCAAAGNIAGALSTQRPGGTEAFRDKDLREGFLRQRGFYELIARPLPHSGGAAAATRRERH
ncbi:MAG TPA: carbohydrate kinase family protein [Acidobacteriaceae bacterium]|jgi:sugar/nucleoside kinase (ribokinase family)|nr:carbohydrate kinase family protein [Acidobacteriaceae bacterium]